jgi:hypothetical protein
MNDDMPAGHGPVGDDQWNDFVNRFASETAPAPVAAGAPAPAPAWRRVLPWFAAPAVVAAAVAGFLVLRPTDSSPDEAAAPAEPAATATAASTPSPEATTAPPASVRAMVPLAQAFPAKVGSGPDAFTKVAAVTMPSCTQPDSVGPRLIEMINESKGCVGEEIALYKDGHDNQFNLAVFTMNDPQDTLRLVTELSMAFDDYEVGAQAPPPDSGLPTLPADSGLIQSFTGQERAMVVGLGQWSDGRTSDYQKLVDRLEPLLKAVSANVAGYEAAQ